jgi:hypothetical protein
MVYIKDSRSPAVNLKKKKLKSADHTKVIIEKVHSALTHTRGRGSSRRGRGRRRWGCPWGRGRGDGGCGVQH